MSTDERAAKALRDAIELLERDGWCQRTFINNQNQRCVLGAVRGMFWEGAKLGGIEFADTRAKHVAVYSLAIRTLRAFADQDLSLWNDTEGRTVEEVIALLTRAAERLEDQALLGTPELQESIQQMREGKTHVVREKEL